MQRLALNVTRNCAMHETVSHSIQWLNSPWTAKVARAVNVATHRDAALS
jgi:hypothetical protein